MSLSRAFSSVSSSSLYSSHFNNSCLRSSISEPGQIQTEVCMCSLTYRADFQTHSLQSCTHHWFGVNVFQIQICHSELRHSSYIIGHKSGNYFPS
jgi:hypothetical protein